MERVRARVSSSLHTSGGNRRSVRRTERRGLQRPPPVLGCQCSNAARPQQRSADANGPVLSDRCSTVTEGRGYLRGWRASLWREVMPEQDGDDLYETLQVSPRADIDVIEAAYRALARRYHPDRDPSPGATARMARINHAWDVLSQPESRAAYDRERLAPRPPVPAGDEPDQTVCAGPKLTIEPERLAQTLRRGQARSLTVAVHTDPPGIRVDAVVTAGEEWLTVRPTTLRGLDQDRVTIDVRS